MNTEDLARTLRAAAGVAPEPLGDLAAAVAARRTARTRARTRTALAVAAVVIVAGGGTAAIRNAGGNGAALGPAAVTPTAPLLTPAVVAPALPARPAKDVWPGAVFKMPAGAGDGWRYRPITALDPRHLLVFAERSPDRFERIEVYDIALGTSTVLATMPERPDLVPYYVQGADADAEHVIWYAVGTRDGERVTEFWVVGREGGTPRLITTLSGEAVEQAAVAGGRLVWSLAGGGVFSMPLAGGVMEEFTESSGYRLLTWPWVTQKPLMDERGRGRQTVLVNLETQARKIVRATEGLQNVRCGPSFCFGGTVKDRKPTAVVQRLDGSGRQELPGLSGVGIDSLIADRFVVVFVAGASGDGSYRPAAAVYDRVTGAVGGIGASNGNGGGTFGQGISSSSSLVLYWGADASEKPDEYWVLNLAAVPPVE
ncbi:hypothetical protein [Sphaerisporangium aureirubrum]|uniref:WD40 repeat domain-containing protein n=1 Tax=Sphaerisporangium aureirubrum TaxID=1544736 RepID=A0ABW1NYS3_9ACTN